jgi:hypothetical protein
VLFQDEKARFPGSVDLSFLQKFAGNSGLGEPLKIVSFQLQLFAPIGSFAVKQESDPAAFIYVQTRPFEIVVNLRSPCREKGRSGVRSKTRTYSIVYPKGKVRTLVCR